VHLHRFHRLIWWLLTTLHHCLPRLYIVLVVYNQYLVLPSVWAVRRKRNLTTGEITKHKARLNLHGGKQEFGMTYCDTYAPVVTWFAIRLLIVFGILFSWSLRQVNFVMAYPQAPIEMDMYGTSKWDQPQELGRCKKKNPKYNTY